MIGRSRPAPLRCRRRREEGYATLLVASMVIAVFLPAAAISVDVARWYVEVERVQAAADAAATAGVTFLPDNLVEAQRAARDAAARNGFPAGPDVEVSVERGEKPTQLVVTVAHTIPDAFSATFTDGFSRISRRAVADYNGPAPMGSPCNTHGNEPNGSPGAGPVSSQLSVPAGASCLRVPQFWAHIQGPNVQKTQGDQFSTRYCVGYEDGCTGTTNDEFDPAGDFIIVRVGAAAVGAPITIQLYDPAYVATGARCTSAPSGTIGSNNWNPYATTDAISRYARTAGAFCSGDDPSSGLRVGPETPTITSFALRRPIDTLQPRDAEPIAGCIRQYPGYSASNVTADRLRSSHSSYNADLAAVFHQWVPLCTFTPSRAGDHYLQVRTNVALGGSPDGRGGRIGNTAVVNQTGDNLAVTGNGANGFAVRAISTQAQAISVSGWERMTIYANTDAAETVFNLVRVVPAAATKTLNFSFFDAGDAASNGSIQILPPTESGLTLADCSGVGMANGPLPNCQVTGIRRENGWDGKTQHIRVPIPGTYTCNVDSAGGCWFRVRVSFGSGQVTDVTTWRAVIEGDPVRLIE